MIKSVNVGDKITLAVLRIPSFHSQMKAQTEPLWTRSGIELTIHDNQIIERAEKTAARIINNGKSVVFSTIHLSTPFSLASHKNYLLGTGFDFIHLDAIYPAGTSHATIHQDAEQAVRNYQTLLDNAVQSLTQQVSRPFNEFILSSARHVA